MAHPRGRRSIAPPHSGNNDANSNSSMLIMIVLSVASFFAGTLFSLQAAIGNTQVVQPLSVADCNIEAIVAARVKEALKNMPAVGLKGSAAAVSTSSSDETRFPATVKKYATGMSRMTKLDFTNQFDMGVPLDQVKEGEEDVLLLYSSERAHPTKQSSKVDVKALQTPVPHLSVDDAIENCDELHIILTDQTNRKQCVALVPQFESFHIQKWMRVDGHGGKLDHAEALKYVSRGYQSNGREKFRPPEPKHTKKFWDMLGPYIESMDEVLGNLKPLLEKVANHKNQVIIMVCNMGQSELLMNFVCSLKARGLDYSQVLVFATDEETKALAESMGLTAFFDEIVSVIILLVLLFVNLRLFCFLDMIRFFDSFIHLLRPFLWRGLVSAAYIIQLRTTTQPHHYYNTCRTLEPCHRKPPRVTAIASSSP